MFPGTEALQFHSAPAQETVKGSIPAGAIPAEASRMPNGRKNMLATQCSKPQATNAAMGKRIPSILSATVLDP